MLRMNPDYSSSRGISWNQWRRRLEERARRCANPYLPDAVSRAIWDSLAKWVERTFFRGTAQPRQQYEYWLRPPSPEHIGMYGRGTAPAPDHIINPWERLAGGHEVKRVISTHRKNADVLASSGPGFLESMFRTGPIVQVGPSSATIQVHTQATMTPYDPTAGGTRPIMYYLVNGWQGQRAMMRPRWPNGVVEFMGSPPPYQQHLSGISRYIITGR